MQYSPLTNFIPLGHDVGPSAGLATSLRTGAGGGLGASAVGAASGVEPPGSGFGVTSSFVLSAGASCFVVGDFDAVSFGAAGGVVTGGGAAGPCGV